MGGHIIKPPHKDPWVAQSVKHPTLDLSSGLDLRVVSSSPTLGFKKEMSDEVRDLG